MSENQFESIIRIFTRLSERMRDMTPVYDELSPLNIQDLLLLENRDRIYDQDIYVMRGVYNAQDVDFDLSQFGLFLNNDTLFITFHYNNMIDVFQRKLMVGDVLELPNLKDYYPLNSNIPEALPKYYVIQDAAFASEGFSQTWLPHLWRVKATPLTNAQEYKDILKKPMVKSTIWDNDNFYPAGDIARLLRSIMMRRRALLLLSDGEGHALCARQRSQVVDEVIRVLV